MRRTVSHLTVVASRWLLVLNVGEVLSHGMLVNPVNRGSMWREGYPTPINYDDNGNYCGGYGKQWDVNDGRCGVCGDDYSLAQPRPNENTGTYGNGIVVAAYERGSRVNLTVMITANHGGYFNFHVCQLTSGPNEIETEDCFDEYPLPLDDGTYSYSLDTRISGVCQVTVKLPDSLNCQRCVLRWHWTTASNWGECTEDGLRPKFKGNLGCGPQETFRTCSDVSIS